MPLKLFKRKTRDGRGIWHYRGTIIVGDRLRGTTGTTDRKIAARIVSEIENRHHKRHLDGPQEVLTFPQAVALYEKAGKARDKRSERYIAKLEDHWKNAKIKDMSAGGIRQSAIDLYPGCSGATWNRQVITPTQAVINHCAELELCPPVRIKRFKFEKKIKKPITPEWLDTFCAHADKQMVALATFMFATGCRISEAMRLEWSDIDFQQRTILIRKTKNKKERLPHMPGRLLIALANLPRDAKPFGNPESTLRRAWDGVIEAAAKTGGFERLTFHSCRHGFATKLLRDGIDPKTAASLGGWDSVSLFLETYAHAMPNTRITEDIFDTPVARESTVDQQKQEVTKK
jgi:integrase